MYVISGASGNIGKVVALELLSNGKKVRVIGRNADKLRALTDKGAEALVGDLADDSFLKKAYSGADAVFVMIPPNTHSNDFKAYQKKIANNHLGAVKTTGVKHIILLSSIGAHLRNGAGVVDGLGYLEEIFSDLKDVHVLNLRPTSFMENFFGQIGTIKQMGIAGSPVKADLRFPMVATRDIAAVAAKRLLDLSFTGNTVEYVLGPADISYNEVTTVIGKAIGKPDLKYVQFSYDDAKKGMVQSGFVSENVADLYNGLAEGLNNGSALNDHKRTPKNSTPTSIENFAQVFAHVFNNS
jgi:uncharacterized protein YbjT (DUF2867 family)